MKFYKSSLKKMSTGQRVCVDVSENDDGTFSIGFNEKRVQGSHSMASFTRDEVNEIIASFEHAHREDADVSLSNIFTLSGGETIGQRIKTYLADKFDNLVLGAKCDEWNEHYGTAPKPWAETMQFILDRAVRDQSDPDAKAYLENSYRKMGVVPEVHGPQLAGLGVA